MGQPSDRYLRSKGREAKTRPAVRHPNPVPHILIPRCQAATASGDQCKNESSRWEFCYQHRAAGEE